MIQSHGDKGKPGCVCCADTEISLEYSSHHSDSPGNFLDSYFSFLFINQSFSNRAKINRQSMMGSFINLLPFASCSPSSNLISHFPTFYISVQGIRCLTFLTLWLHDMLYHKTAMALQYDKHSIKDDTAKRVKAEYIQAVCDLPVFKYGHL